MTTKDIEKIVYDVLATIPEKYPPIVIHTTSQAVIDEFHRILKEDADKFLARYSVPTYTAKPSTLLRNITKNKQFNYHKKHRK